MPVPQIQPLLVTSRPDFAQRIADHAPDIEFRTATPDAVTISAWTTASAIVVDAQAATTLCSRGLPVNRRVHVVVTDTPPEPQDWSNAVALRAERVIVLPEGGPWLAAALEAAAHRATVIAVAGIGSDATDTVSAVAGAVALGHLGRDAHVALVGLQPSSATLQRQLDRRVTANPGPPRAGALTLVLWDGEKPADGGTTSSLIAELSGSYDVIVLDVPSPPCAAGAEAISTADIVLTVTRPDEQRNPDDTAAGRDDDPFGPALDDPSADLERRWRPHPAALRHAWAVLAAEPAADLAVIPLFQPSKTRNCWVSGQPVRTVFGVVLLSQNTFTPTGLIPGHSWARDTAARIAAERLHAWAAQHPNVRADDGGIGTVAWATVRRDSDHAAVFEDLLLPDPI